MKKSVLQRLFGFLREITGSPKADPPSCGDSCCDRRPRLVVIEGGIGKEGREGNGRERPCAVIGIPYSSDTEDSVEEEEEEEETEERVIKNIAKFMIVFAAAAAAVFALNA